MAIVQAQAVVTEAARVIGIGPERATDIKNLSVASIPLGRPEVTTLAGLRRVMNNLGFYDEQADRLQAVAVPPLTFA